jgi:hypothetical protein
VTKKRSSIKVPKELHDELYIVRIKTNKTIGEIISDATRKIREEAKKSMGI